jgi:hypothetical protein
VKAIISKLADVEEECSIFNGEDLMMLILSNTKSSMLYKLVRGGKTDWTVLDDK